MKRLRLGVIGTGSVVREIYQHLYFRSRYSPLVSVEAICDTSPEALRSFGDAWGIPQDRRFSDYEKMLAAVELDAVAVNTPDDRHVEPTIAALEAGVDVLLPKPTAERCEDVHRIMATAKRNGRLLLVDFHKREDPVVKEVGARIADGAYGTVQSATFHMLDRLLVADPNHEPRFFSSPDFAARNSPVSFLTSHMADTFITMTKLRPIEVRAIGYRQKLRSLMPIAVDGYDLVDTSVVFEGGVCCHIVTGWALPNTADCLTVQSGRIVCSDGMVDLWDNHYGLHEITHAAVENRNALFLTFASDGTVSGYGVDSPGRLLQQIARYRAGELTEAELTESRSPYRVGLYTTLVCECALASLAGAADGPDSDTVIGVPIDAKSFLADRIPDAQEFYKEEGATA